MTGWPEPASEIVGRGTERQAVMEFLGGISSGPIALVIEGDPGIGKSTIWRDGVAQARSGGCRVLACQPASAEVRMSFAALGDLLESVIDELAAELDVPLRLALDAALLRGDLAYSPHDERGVSVAVLSSPSVSVPGLSGAAGDRRRPLA